MSDTVKAKLPCEHDRYDGHELPYDDEIHYWCNGGEVVELRWEQDTIMVEHRRMRRLVGEWEKVDDE